MSLEQVKQLSQAEKAELLERPIDQRRAELIEQRALGVEMREIVRSLSGKYECNPKCIYDDWRERRKWAPKIIGLEDGESLTVDIVTLLNWLKRRAVMEVLQGDNSAAKIGAIKTVRDVAMGIYEIAKDTGKIQVVPAEMKLKLEMSGLGKSPFATGAQSNGKPADSST